MLNTLNANNWQPKHQQGLVLFIALIALVAISLASVALMRSVDTSVLVAGNLAFKQTATNSGDSGVEGAVQWLTDTSNASASDPWADVAYALNNDDVLHGYYSSTKESEDDPEFLYKDTTWATAKSAPAVGSLYKDGIEYADATLTKPTGNVVRYIIQRMCRAPNQTLSAANCLFSDTSEDNRSKRVLRSDEAGGGVISTSSPIYRITARVVGPKNTTSFIQAYAY